MKIYVRNRGVPKTRNLDRQMSTPPEQIGVFKSEIIGARRSRTPQGYLLCEEVPIARTGEMLYADGDLVDDKGQPIVKPSPYGVVRVTRDVSELFQAATLASFVGMPITDDHPADGDVSLMTWKERACGFVLNVRPGSGENADCIVCDFLITVPQMILDIDAGKREVSAGYDAGYLEIQPGYAMQVRIMGNHVALVERGRCGPRCAIGDSATVMKKESTMPTITRKPATSRRVVDVSAMRKRIMDAAEDAFNQEMDAASADDGADGPTTSGGDGHTHIHIHGIGGAPAPAEAVAAGASAPGAGSNSAPAAVGTDNVGETAPVASPEDRLTALETGMQQILNAIKPLVEGAAAPATGAPPAAKEPPTEPAATPPAAKVPTEDAASGLDADDEKEMAAVTGNTMDSESLASIHASTKAMAEVLFPGFQFPEFDKAAPRATTQDSICGARRRVLDMAYSTAAGRQVIDTLRGTTVPLDVQTLPCAQCGLMFKTAAGAMKLIKTRDTVGTVTLPTSAPAAPIIGSQSWYEQQAVATKKFWAARQAVPIK